MTSFLSATCETEEGRTQAANNTEQNSHFSKPLVLRVIGTRKLHSSYRACCICKKMCEAFHDLRVSFLINCGRSCNNNLAIPLPCASKWIECPLQKNVGNNGKCGADTVPIIWCIMSVSQCFCCNEFIYTYLYIFAKAELLWKVTQVNLNPSIKKCPWVHASSLLTHFT